jgi:hypothetical protein
MYGVCILNWFFVDSENCSSVLDTMNGSVLAMIRRVAPPTYPCNLIERDDNNNNTDDGSAVAVVEVDNNKQRKTIQAPTVPKTKFKSAPQVCCCCCCCSVFFVVDTL